jgi:hypothetical protein
MAETPGKKYDAGKPPAWQGVRQYFPRALLAVADVSRYGANKYNLAYNDKNWARVADGFARYSDGLDRHLTGEFIDGPIDPESGCYHAAMAAWNALARLELLLIEEQKKKDEEQRVDTSGG